MGYGWKFLFPLKKSSSNIVRSFGFFTYLFSIKINEYTSPMDGYGISGIQFSPGFLDSSGARIRQFQETSGVGDARVKTETG